MGIIHLLIYYLGIQLLISTLLYFYYLVYYGAQCAEGEDVQKPPSNQNKETTKDIYTPGNETKAKKSVRQALVSQKPWPD